MRYPSDLSDSEWSLLCDYFERRSGAGRPFKYPVREIVNACLYVLHTGCQWRALPKDFPPWDSVYFHFRRWRDDGHWQFLLRHLHGVLRKLEGRQRSPSAGALDSQSVKSTRKKGAMTGVSVSAE